MAEDNPIEGLDPNQSAFEPMLDMMNQETPEDLSRTTTTTTLYISGDQTQIDQPKETVKQDDPIKKAVDNFRLYQQQQGMSANVGDVNKLFPNTTAEQRIQLVESYPELFKEDRIYNQSAEKQYQEGLDSGKSSLEILDSLVDQDFGSRVGLMKRFPNLFSETDIQADQQKKVDDDNMLSQDKEVQKKIKDLNAEYDKATDFNQKRRIQEQIIELQGQPDVFERRAKIDVESVIPKEITEEDKELIFRDINPEYVTPIIKDQSEKDFFDLNNQIVSIQGGDLIPEEEYISVYKKGEYDPEKHKKYDEILSKSILGLISTDMPADIHKSFFDRNGIAKSEILLRNKLILENTPGLDRSKIYTDEEIAGLEAAANQRLLEKTGDVEFEEQKIILGENIRPMDLYNDRLIDSKNTISPLNTAVIVEDEEATLQNLQELFPESSGTQFRFSKSDLDGKDAITIRTFFLGEEVNSMEINLREDNEPTRKIRRFMSESLIPADIQKDMFDLSQGEGKFVTKDGDIDKVKLSLFSTLHPQIFGSVDEYSTDDFLSFTYEKSPFMIDPAEIRRQISYIQAERESMPAFGLGSTKRLVPQETIDMLENQIQVAAAVHAEKLKQKGGGILGAVKYGYMSGASGIYEFIEDRMTDAKFLFGSYGISDERKKELRSRGFTEDQIYNVEKKYVKDKTESAINKALGTFSKESQESIAESGLVNEVLMNTISSLVTMSGGAGTKLGVRAAFALTSQARLENELKDTNLTDLEKFALTMPMAVLEGVFEEFGMQSALRPGLSSAKKAILMRAIKDLPKDASAKTLNQSIKRVINELAGGTGQKITKAMVSEALTEATQQGAEIVEKNIYNAIAEKELFKNVPDVTTIEGFTRATEEVMEAAKMGALSGGLIQGMSQVSNYTVNGFKNAKDVDFEQTYQSLTDNVYRELLMDQIDVKVLAGELSEQDATTIKENFNKAYPIMMEIPSELSSSQKQQSYDLLLERKALESEVKDKDKNLVVKQTERIAEINNQLQQISKTDAIQEQETKKEVLPDEQSEMGLQEVGQRDTQGKEAAEVQQEEISPENSSNYANLTEDQEGNVVFFHRGQKGYETVKPSTGKNKATSREEAAAIGKVGGVAMYYTDQNDAETAVSGDSQYAVKVPKSKVYDANTDFKNIKEEAKKRHEQENPGKAFDANTQLAYITKIAGEQGYEMIVAQWDGKTRAQTTQELTPTDVQEVDGNTVTKSFNEKYESNKDKGFVPVIPVTQEEGLTEVYKDIQNEKSNNQEYDDVYFLFDSNSRNKYSQEQITKMINDSNLSQEIKDKYNNIIQAKPESRRSEKVRESKPGSRLFNDPNPETSDISAKYKKEKGIETTAGEKITELDTNKSMEIADAYEAMENNPNDPEVKEAYEALAKETIDQYKAMTDAGYEIEIYEGKGEPYANSQEMIDDLINNKHMYIFSTEQGYGEAGITDQQRQENAMLAETEFVDKNGKPLLINDLFRGVHDFFGHSERGNGFGAKGEENAWDVHARMFTDKARRAMTAETRGQNSWVNFGPQMRDSNGNLLKKGDPGYKTARERDFAPQKIGLLPEQYSEITDTPTTEVTEEVVENAPVKQASKKEAKGIRKQIENARKAIAKILPGVEIVVHENEDSYRKATNETDSKKQASRGEYNAKTKKIHINISKANNRTVAHEVFHAILLSKVKTDQAAKDLTERMIKALSKNLEGMPEVKQALDAFAANYDENIQSEEKLAELVGLLAGNYAQMNKPSQNLIKRFLDRLAKMFGLKTFTDGEVVDLLNTIAGKVSVGEEISDIDVKVISEGASTFIAEPTKIEARKSIGEKVVASNKPAELSFVTKKDLIDIESLVKEIADKKQKVWFWVADQMGRGMYSDVVVDGQHFLDAGPSYALDPVNKSKDIIWATGKDKSEIEKLIGQSDFIFIISGSPIGSKLFNKKNIDILEDRIGDYSKFKNDLLKSKPTKPIRDILNKHNSWNSLKESPDRKKLLIAFENQKDKNTATKKVLSKYNAFIDFNSLRDGFYRENDFKMNEVMLVLKPTAYGGKSNHSTYENDILGEVIGVPDAKVDSFDLMPEAVRKKYSETLGASQKTQVVAPYGVGVIEIQYPAKRKQKDDGPVESSIDIRELKKKSDKKIKETNKGKGPILRRLRRGLFDRQNDIKRVIKDFVPNPKKVSKIINRIVTKAGASGYANELFTQQDKKIFGKLKADQIENLELIIYARRIVAINENRRERGMNPYKGMDGLDEQAALQNLEKFEQDLGKKEFDALSERADLYFEAFKNNLKMLRDSGRITEETYENLKDVEYSPIKTLKYIIPQDTMTDEDINNAVSTLGVNKKDIMKLSDMNENEILFDARFLLMMNTNIVVRRSFENEMLNEFAQGYESIDKAGKEALSDFIIDGPVKKVPLGFRKVEYFQDGVKKEMVMREDYAMQLLDIKNQNNFLKGLGKITGANILRFFATGGNPLFIVGNTAVDFANIAFFSDVYSSIKPLATVQLAYDFVKNFLRKSGNTKNYNKIKIEFMEHGGAMDFLSTDGLRMVQDMKLKNRILNKAQKGLAAYARFMSYVGETGEMSFRLAVYERVKKAEIKKFEKENDRSPNQQEMEDIMFEAAAQSRETIDFSQGGTWVKQMDQALPYFNAAMQGLRRPLDFARKNPVGFTSNVVQYAVMAAGMTATSLGTLLRAIGDDEEEKKKVQDILDSISMYEKANYHIIFTGNKDKDGNYQYVRIKKLPLLSILGTATEQYTTKYLLKSQGIDYNTDDKAIKKSIEMSAPLDVLGPVMGDESVGQALGGIVKRNPLAAAWLTYTYNEDTFTGDKVFYDPKDKKIKPYAEGLYDDRVNDIYKVVAPALDMSPKRAQAAVEKIVTSESTNPSISIFYALTNGLFDTEADAFKENSDTFDNGMGHFLDVVSKKMVRHTNPNLLRYKNQDRLEDLEKSIDTDAYLTNKKIRKEIDKSINFKNFRGQGDEYYKEQEKMDELFKKYDVDTLDRNSYVSYAELKDLKGNQLFKEMSSILYEKNPKMMAARLYEMYGNDFDIEAEETLLNTFKVSKRNSKVLLRGEKFYNKYYLNKSQEEIDKFEKTFGKIR